MSKQSAEKPMIEGPNGTARYLGKMQWPMTREDQQRAGLIATNSRSITGRIVKTQGEGA